MLVFLSWSGKRSKKVAEAFQNWLGQVIQAVDAWISSDIDKGSRWGFEIADRLEQSKVGIICLTKDNLDSKWIHFEAGAISKTKDAFVCTLLLDLKHSDVEQPLAQFQHTTVGKDDIYRLLQTINQTVKMSDERSLSEPILKEVFETNWPRLEAVLQDASISEESTTEPMRSDSEILQEILQLTRRVDRRQSLSDQEEVIQRKFQDYLQGLKVSWEDAFSNIHLKAPRLERDTEASEDKLEVWRWQSEDGRLNAGAYLERNGHMHIHITSSDLTLEGERIFIGIGPVNREVTFRRVSETEVCATIDIPRSQRPKNMKDLSFQIR